MSMKRYEVETLIGMGAKELNDALVGKTYSALELSRSMSFFTSTITKVESISGCLHVYYTDQSSFFSRDGQLLVGGE